MTALDRVDHLVVAAPDLEQGVAWVEERLGVRLLPGGLPGGLGRSTDRHQHPDCRLDHRIEVVTQASG